MNDGIIRKTCSKCGFPKDICNFNKCARNKDGLNSYCKLCQKEYNNKRYDKNKDKIVEGIKDWQEKNEEKVKGYKKNFYDKSKLEGNGQ